MRLAGSDCGGAVSRTSDKYLRSWLFELSCMPTRYTVICDDDRAREIRELSRKFDLTEEEVLRQLVDLGLEHLDEEAPA